MNLDLQDHRTFANGVVHLHYRPPMNEGWPTHG